MLAQIHLSSADLSAEPEPETPKYHARVRQAAEDGNPAPTALGTLVPLYSKDRRGLLCLQASSHAVPSASGTLLPTLYLAKLWSSFMAQLRGPILRSLP